MQAIPWLRIPIGPAIDFGAISLTKSGETTAKEPINTPRSILPTINQKKLKIDKIKQSIIKIIVSIIEALLLPFSAIPYSTLSSPPLSSPPVSLTKSRSLATSLIKKNYIENFSIRNYFKKDFLNFSFH